jgi:drug/metabolite transporter (DMT)-like permease
MGKYYSLIVLSAFMNAAFLVVNRIVVADHTVSTLMFACGSVFCGALCCLLYLGWTQPRGLWRHLDRRTWLWLILYGTMTGFVARLVLVYGQSLSSVINAGFLSRLSPIFTLCFAYLFMHETLSVPRLGVIGVMIVGSLLVANKGHLALATIQVGDGMLILFACLLGFDQALARKILTAGVAPIVVTAMRYIMGAVAMVVFVVVMTPMSVVQWGPRLLAVDFLLGSLLSGLFVFVTTVTRDRGLVHIKAGVVGALMLCSPVFTTLMGIFLLHEPLTPGQEAGGAIILVASYLLSRKEVQRPGQRAVGWRPLRPTGEQGQADGSRRYVPPCPPAGVAPVPMAGDSPSVG